MLVYIILYLVLALVAGHIGESLWANSRHNVKSGVFVNKLAACKFMYGILGLGVIATQGPLGVFGVAAGLPVCFAHLNLIMRNQYRQLTGMAIARHMREVARSNFRGFINHGRLNGRN